MSPHLDPINDLYRQLDTLCVQLGEALDDEADRQQRGTTAEELGITDSVRAQAPSMLEALRQVPAELRLSPAWRHDFEVLERLVAGIES